MKAKELFEFLEKEFLTGKPYVEELASDELRTSYGVLNEYIITHHHWLTNQDYVIFDKQGKKLSDNDIVTLALELSVKKETK